MAYEYSDAARQNMLATSADEPYLTLLEISHPELEEPVRVVNDSQNIIVGGHEYIACPFRVTKPDDVDQQLPKAQLEVDNIGRDLTYWLESSNGGKGARCRIMECLRSTGEIEFDIELDLTGLYIDNKVVGGTLGFENTLAQSAVTVRFDPLTAPGLW